MASIYLRNIDPILKVQVKVAAAEAGMTLEAYCEQKLGGNPGKKPVAAVATPPSSGNHDSKTCKVYKCGMCKAAKENNEKN
jgi:hypothetical protein